MRNRALLRRIRSDKQNVRFSDFIRLVEAFGFAFFRRMGSHRAYRHACGAMLTIQEKDGQAKAYQIKQFLDAIDNHDLRIDDEAP